MKYHPNNSEIVESNIDTVEYKNPTRRVNLPSWILLSRTPFQFVDSASCLVSLLPSLVSISLPARILDARSSTVNDNHDNSIPTAKEFLGVTAFQNTVRRVVFFQPPALKVSSRFSEISRDNSKVSQSRSMIYNVAVEQEVIRDSGSVVTNDQMPVTLSQP